MFKTSYHSLETVQKMISDQNCLCYDSQLRGRPFYMFECIHYRLFLLMVSCTWLLPDPLHFTTSLLQLLKGVDSIWKVITFIIVYRGAL